MSINVSVRIDEELAERLRLYAAAAGETISQRLRRYAEEGSRLEEHPFIVFRDGPTGRRAGLVGGPDVWEVAMWLDDLSGEKNSIGVLAAETGISRSHIEAVVRYRAAYSEEIEAHIALHRRMTQAVLQV
jgi:hypothetical protein